jgi:hypothetical protein
MGALLNQLVDDIRDALRLLVYGSPSSQGTRATFVCFDDSANLRNSRYKLVSIRGDVEAPGSTCSVRQNRRRFCRFLSQAAGYRLEAYIPSRRHFEQEAVGK